MNFLSVIVIGSFGFANAPEGIKFDVRGVNLPILAEIINCQSVCSLINI